MSKSKILELIEMAPEDDLNEIFVALCVKLVADGTHNFASFELVTEDRDTADEMSAALENGLNDD